MPRKDPPSAEVLEQARIVQRHVKRLRNFMLGGPPPRSKTDHWQGKRLPDPTFPQIRAMLTLSTLGPSTLKDFAADMNISAGAASEMVERLVEAGWVTRQQDPSDRRRVVIELTPAAADLAEAHERAVLGQLARMMQVMDSEYVHQWVELATYMAGILDRLEPESSTPSKSPNASNTGADRDV